MMNWRFGGFWRATFNGGASRPKFRNSTSRDRRADQGFTLVELLISVTIIPLIVGALATGLLAMFTLQSSVANRLSNSGDAQVVSANYRIDVQSAAYVTTDSASTPQCGTSSSQLLGLEWNPSSSGGFQTMVSYDSVTVTNGGNTTYSLVRQFCTSGSQTPVSTTTISTNLTLDQARPTVICSTSSCNDRTSWIAAQNVKTITFDIHQPGPSTGSNSCASSTNCYQYTLTGVPVSSASKGSTGGPISVSSFAGCGFATAGTGTLASSLCLVDFSSLTGNNMIAARQSCLQMAVPLPGGATMYFCIGITGGSVVPYGLPTWTQAFLGGSINNTPFYTGIPGNAALYQNGAGNLGGTTTITMSNITIIGPTGVPATGWQVVGIDAESTDNGESITFRSDQPLSLIPNSSSSVVGNAYNSGAGIVPQSVLTGGTSNTIVCNGNSTSGNKTGTAMVDATMPSTFTTTLVGTGLEGMSFGVVF